MTGKSDRLMQLAEDLRCAKCRVRPRVANRQVCRECSRQAEERERQARSRLIPTPGRSNHQQAGASVSATRKARRATRAAEPLPRPSPPARTKVQPRQPPEPLTAKSWKTKLADWVKRCWGANDPDVQERVAIRDIGGDIIEQTAFKIDYVFGGPHGAPHMRVFANGDPHLDVMRSVAERMWQLPVKGEVVTANGVSDLRTACPHCGVMVRIPCNESRARNCQNRRTR
jgi:hypothetical protein